MDTQEIRKVEQFLRKRFGSDRIAVKPRPKAMVGRSADSFADSAEVFMGSESIALVYRDDEDGDVSYILEMSILQEDLD